MDKLIPSLLVEEKWASAIWIWLSWLIFGWSVAAHPSSSRCPCITWGMPTFLNHLFAEFWSTSDSMTEFKWLHSIPMYPAGLPKACAKAQIASDRLAFALSQVVFLAHHELCSCPQWMKHLPYSWRGVRRMRGVFHICVILQISENSVAVKNIISKTVVLFRREISLSTYKEKKNPKPVFILLSVLSSADTISLSFCRPYFTFSLAISDTVLKKNALFNTLNLKGLYPVVMLNFACSWIFFTSGLGLNVLSWIKEDAVSVP